MLAAIRPTDDLFGPVTPGEFAALMASLGPFEASPRLAVAVSGGADSLALALLAGAWARTCGGDAVGLIVDHGIRAESAAEAALTCRRLASFGMAAQVLTLPGLRRGAGLAARARAARYQALSEACASAGWVHLLLAHHAADQAETMAMRLLAGSGPSGLAAMPALRELAQIRLLRPLLTVPPSRLRATLSAAGLDWVEDPSNVDPAAQRTRLRLARRDRDGAGPATLAMVAAASARGRARAEDDWRLATTLAARARVAPEGYALLTPGPLEPALLAALIRMVSGSIWTPSPGQIAALAAQPRPATLGGARILAARRLRPGGWIVTREAAAMQQPILAAPGACWDGRFHFVAGADQHDSTQIGALGEAAAQLRHGSALPFAVLQTLPALWRRGELAAVPHLRYYASLSDGDARFQFAPGQPATGAPFATSAAGG